MIVESACPLHKDEQHCNCWYDGGECCACGDPAMANAEILAQGGDL